MSIDDPIEETQFKQIGTPEPIFDIKLRKVKTVNLGWRIAFVTCSIFLILGQSVSIGFHGAQLNTILTDPTQYPDTGCTYLCSYLTYRSNFAKYLHIVMPSW
jgi:hypothetical protein